MPFEMSDKVIYIAGPYTGVFHDHRSYSEIDRNISAARDASILLANAGVPYFCPHMHSAHYELITPAVPAAFWYKLDIHFLEACDGILMLPGWYDSRGSKEEKRLMEEWGRPVFFEAEDAIAWARMD